MLNRNELFNFDEEEEEPQYIYIENYNVNGKYIDISIFTEEEFEYLETINKHFCDCQRNSQDDSDSSHTWKFHKDNPEREKNKLYEDRIYWMDRKIKENFCVKCKFLLEEPHYQTKKELSILFDNLTQKYFEEDISKDGIRKWFVENMDTINANYHSTL
jgi:hypothetical protein